MSEERYFLTQKEEFGPFQPLLCLRYGRGGPVSDRLTTKINITFFNRKLDAEYLFIRRNVFEKTVLSEDYIKNYFGATFDHYLGKGGFLSRKVKESLLTKIRSRIFYHLTI